MIDRRKLLKSGAGAVPMMLLKTRPGLAMTSVLVGNDDMDWQQRLRRIGQTNMTEHDPAVMDVEAWADYWASLKVGATFISVTGILAFYPTKVPFHRRAKYLGDRDFFGELNAAARKRGIRTIARMSPDLNWGDALAAHPEWFQRDAHGQPKPTADDPRLYQTCMFSTYMTDYMPAVMREVSGRYEVDALFCNGWPPLGSLPVCFCEACKKLPPAGTPAYWDKFTERVIFLWQLYDGIAQERKASSFFFANLGGGVHAGPNLAKLGPICKWFQADNQGRGGEAEPIWGCTLQGRVCRSVLDGKIAANVVGDWSTGPIRWRESIKSAPEAQMWLDETIASGMVPYLHVIGSETGAGEDQRYRDFGREYFEWTAKHDRHLNNINTLAEIGVVWGQSTQLFYKPAHDSKTGDSMSGLYSALLEGRFFFDFVHEDLLDLSRIRRYKALLLPSIALLSDHQCEQLRAYVNAGGSILATFETSVYDETNRRRADFGLADLFGTHAKGPIIGRPGNANPFYARIERTHPVLDGFKDTAILPGAEYRVPITAVSDPVLTVVPGYAAYPPELSYPDPARTDEPAVVLREIGHSRIAYFPGDIERSLWLSGNTDLSILLQNAIRWVCGEAAPPVTVTGGGLIESFAWRTEAGYALHVLNYTNPNAHRGWLRQFDPIGPQQIRFSVADTARIAKVELLRRGGTVPFHRSGNVIEFTIDRIDDYEIAALS